MRGAAAAADFATVSGKDVSERSEAGTADWRNAKGRIEREIATGSVASAERTV